MGTIFLAIFGLTMVIINICQGIRHRRKHSHHHHFLRLQTIFQNNTNPFNMSLNSLTINDLLPHKGVISVTDDAGNSYSGTISNIQISVSDTTLDNGAVDTGIANTVDITALGPNGATTANLTADFTSQGNGTPAAGSTAQAIPDGTVFTGLKGTVSIINDIKTAISLKLAVNF